MSHSVHDRRDFLKFMGRTAGTVGALPWVLQFSCPSNAQAATTAFPFKPLEHNLLDKLTLADGLKYDILIKWQDPINAKDKFGTHNDFLAYLPLPGKKDEGILLVNHEYYDGVLYQQRKMGAKRTDEDIREQMRGVGNSLLHVKWNGGRCSVIANSKYNRRITGETIIPFQKGFTIFEKTEAMGTLANCAGGQTPWNTFLSCEENYDQFYGDVEWKDGQRVFIKNNKFNWYEHFPQNPPEHYGWVVEIQPLTGKAVKLVSMGRFEHEAAKVVIGKSGKPVVYMSEDRKFGFIYKFISDSATSLEKGTLYAADTVKGRWIPLDLEKTPILKTQFKTQTEVLTYVNRAANLAGATQQDRPEDVEIDPVSGHIFISLTNNADRGNLYGSIVKITEKNGDYESRDFKFETWMAGSPSVGFACPDNLAFDKKGNLWMTTDMSAHDMGTEKFAKLGHNGLYFVPLQGPHAAKAFLVASAPAGAEMTGPLFSPDYKTLLLSIQHPGEGTEDPTKPTSCWPGKAGEQPKSAVVQISGSLLERLQST